MYERKNTLLGAIFDLQSYKNLIYLLMTFPLGLVYFLLLTIGLSVGAGLAVVLIGIPILLATLALSLVAGDIERTIANILLNTDLPQSDTLLAIRESRFRELFSRMLRPVSWKTLVYIALKFPLGLMSFIGTLMIIAIIGSLLSAPFLLTTTNWPIIFGEFTINSTSEALIAFVIGLGLAPFGLWVINKMAAIWREITLTLLDDPELYDYQIGKRDISKHKPNSVYIPQDDDNPFMDDYDGDDLFYDEEKPKRASIGDLIG